MSLSDLSIFADASIALLGFSGLASAVSSISEANRAFITIRLRALLLISGACCFGSLAPFSGLDLFYCSILLAALVGGTIVKLGRDFLRTPGVAPSLPLAVLAVGWGTTGVVFQIYTLVADPALQEMAYMFTLSGSVGVSILFFIRFVLAIVKDSE